VEVEEVEEVEVIVTFLVEDSRTFQSIPTSTRRSVPALDRAPEADDTEVRVPKPESFL
jgi:hypothetical protein